MIAVVANHSIANIYKIRKSSYPKQTRAICFRKRRAVKEQRTRLLTLKRRYAVTPDDLCDHLL